MKRVERYVRLFVAYNTSTLILLDYYNKDTKETRWASEMDPILIEAIQKAAARKAESKVISDCVSDLPSGWKSSVDPGSGKTYYYNKKTKETSWTKPELK